MNLEKVNLALLEVEEGLRDPTPWENAPPIYFVIGAPRSGTTLLTQLLAYCFDFGYITNLAARFWLNPVIGIRLSREILGDTEPSFKSHYANTSHAGDIHEFGQFWMSHLGLSSAQDVDWMVPDEECASLTLRALRAIQSQFRVPIVMKGIYPAYAYEWMNDHFDIRWISIWRDPLDACLSILESRRKKKKSSNDWFGWHIPKSDRWGMDLGSPYTQIVHQVRFFQDVYGDAADVSINLKPLCEDTEFVLSYAIPDYERKREPPKLEYNHKRGSEEDRKKFEELLEIIII